jgi:AcrR family transcriptional regulator
VPQLGLRHEDLVARCLAAFVDAGTLELSLDRLADRVGVSKRMLIHYFGDRDAIEAQVLALLEDRLRHQFSPAAFPVGVAAETVVAALWDQTTAPTARGVLRLLLDVSRRACNGSDRAQAFYAEQQRLWVDLLLHYLPDRSAIADLLQLFQGAVLAYLITGDPGPGRQALMRIVSR